MKFCKNCNHCHKDSRNKDPAYWKCHAIDNGYNPVTGNKYYFYCEEMRASVICGDKGILFQPKSGD